MVTGAVGQVGEGSQMRSPCARHYLGESSSEVQAVLQHALSQSYRGIPAEALVAGSVDEVAERLRTF
jgi:hypothetical protein